LQESFVKRLDHLVYATKDLDATVDALAAQLGVRAAPGGRHHGLGTRNAILAIGPASYLEIIGPDATQPPRPTSRWFGIDALVAPRLVAWAVRDAALEARAAEARAAGFPLGPIEGGSRECSDGQHLSWRFTHPRVLAAEGVLPFFIHWGGGAHPAQGAPTGVQVVSLRAESPQPEPVLALLKTFGLSLNVAQGPSRLYAMLNTPRGAMELS
jgi:Glyoxalase-like domain